MKQHNSTYFRRNMNTVFMACCLFREPVLITTNKGDDEPQQMVIISKAQYDMMISNKGMVITHE